MTEKTDLEMAEELAKWHEQSTIFPNGATADHWRWHTEQAALIRRLIAKIREQEATIDIQGQWLRKARVATYQEAK